MPPAHAIGVVAIAATKLMHLQNLEKDITTRVLHDTFVSFGPILSCKIALDQDNQSKGYGFVQFEISESA
jgi:polyadenylate-binding protein